MSTPTCPDYTKILRNEWDIFTKLRTDARDAFCEEGYKTLIYRLNDDLFKLSRGSTPQC